MVEEETAMGRLEGHERVVVVGGGANRLYSWGYGELVEPGTLDLTPYEAAYLTEEGGLVVLDEGGERLGFPSLVSRFSSSIKGFWISYVIYRDLKRKRYHVKHGIVPTLFLMVYEKGKRDSAKYFVFPMFEGFPVKVSELMELVRHSKNMGKQLLLAIVDRRGEVIYYTCSEVSPVNVVAERSISTGD
ncbi:MAG: hypothetical protein NZ957_03150 [Thaumarchaeota archaeon]|nr:hypothetical protein [Candidatus Calditenuaceae archaeon]MDW8042183.1 hypothetical protein [Nitrososphaerota archaeon]